MDVAGLLKRIQSQTDYDGQLQHVEVLPERLDGLAFRASHYPMCW